MRCSAQLVLARIIEPVSKLDSAAGAGGSRRRAGVVPRPSSGACRPIAKDAWRQQLSAACAAHAGLGPASLVLYDVSTLYFETDEGDGFRESGFSKERRLEPQITIGLLTGADGFPLMVSAFEGNKAETKTMLPVIEAFMAAHQLPDVTVVADAGHGVARRTRRRSRPRGCRSSSGTKIPHVPYVVAQWRREHPGEDIPDGHVFTQPWPAGPNGGRRDQVIYYQYRADRARRTLRGIDEQVAKAEQAVAGKAPVKRNRFIQLSRRHQDRQPRARGQGPGPGRAQGLRHQPGGLPRRHPGHRRVRDRRLPPALPDRESLPDGQERPAGPARSTTASATPIEAHLTIVFAALAVSRWIEHATGWSIRKFVKTARRYRTIQIQAGNHTITAADPLPDDLRHALDRIHHDPSAH